MYHILLYANIPYITISLCYLITQADDWKGHPNPIHEHCHVFGLLHSSASPWGGFQTQVAKKGARLEQEGGFFKKSNSSAYLGLT